MPNALTGTFNKFAGREVDISNPNDPTLAEMSLTAASRGYIFRLQHPDRMYPAQHRADRINAYLEKSPHGKWRISGKFTIG